MHATFNSKREAVSVLGPLFLRGKVSPYRMVRCNKQLRVELLVAWSDAGSIWQDLTVDRLADLLD